jgi:hypothetical protein
MDRGQGGRKPAYALIAAAGHLAIPAVRSALARVKAAAFLVAPDRDLGTLPLLTDPEMARIRAASRLGAVALHNSRKGRSHVAAVEPDPIFAAIEKHRNAEQSFSDAVSLNSRLQEVIPAGRREWNFRDEATRPESDDPSWIASEREVDKRATSQPKRPCPFSTWSRRRSRASWQFSPMRLPSHSRIAIGQPACRTRTMRVA